MKIRGFLFAALVLGGCSLSTLTDVYAQVFHVRPGATGNGSDWNNAYGSLPGTLVRGATYYLADGSYGSYTFDDAHSGTTLITVKKATAEDHGSATGWQAGYGDGQAVFHGMTFSRGYYTIDGAVGGGPGSWETGHGILVTEIDAPQFVDNNSDNITLAHIELDGGATGPSDRRGMVLYAMNNFTIRYCYIHDVGCDMISMNVMNNFTIEYSKLARNHQAEPGCHGDLIEYQIGDASNFVIRYNFIEDIVGSYAFGSHGPNVNGYYIYGNIFYWTRETFFGNGLVGCLSSSGSVSNLKFYNNTMSGVFGGMMGLGILRGSGNEAFNNIWHNNGGREYSIGFNNAIHGNNTIYNGPGGTGETELSGNPFRNVSARDFELTAASAPGKILAAPYDKDMDDNQRRSPTGHWDRGALVFGESAPDTIPPNISGVSASGITTTTANITWTTDEGSNSRVEYGLTTSYGSVVTDAAMVISHSVTLSGLNSGASYQYRVISTDGAGNTRTSGNFTFSTPAPDNTAPVIAGVNATTIGPRNATIVWTTDEPATSGVDYGTTTSYGSVSNRTALVTSHSIRLQALTPSTLYHYRLRSSDASGNIRTSGDFTFTTSAADTTAPAVTLSAPAAGATVSGQATLTATATDSGSGVTQVRFYVDGALIGNGTSVGGSTYSLSWNTLSVANGSHSLNAVARDAEGNEANSAAVTVGVQNTGPDLRTGLAGHWPLDETNGVRATDASVNANAGDIQNGAVWIPGKLRGGLSLDGNNDAIRIAHSSSLGLTEAFTLSAWIRPQANGTHQSVVRKILVDGSHAFPFSSYDLMLIDDAGAFRVRAGASGTDGDRIYAVGNTSLAYGTWYHVVATYDRSNLKVFVNGSEDGSEPYTSGLIQTSGPVVVGRNGAGADLFSGLVDDVRVYSRTLSAAEVQALFNASNPSAPTGVQVSSN